MNYDIAIVYNDVNKNMEQRVMRVLDANRIPSSYFAGVISEDILLADLSLNKGSGFELVIIGTVWKKNAVQGAKVVYGTISISDLFVKKYGHYYDARLPVGVKLSITDNVLKAVAYCTVDYKELGVIEVQSWRTMPSIPVGGEFHFLKDLASEIGISDAAGGYYRTLFAPKCKIPFTSSGVFDRSVFGDIGKIRIIAKNSYGEEVASIREATIPAWSDYLGKDEKVEYLLTVCSDVITLTFVNNHFMKKNHIISCRSWNAYNYYPPTPKEKAEADRLAEVKKKAEEARKQREEEEVRIAQEIKEKEEKERKEQEYRKWLENNRNYFIVYENKDHDRYEYTCYRGGFGSQNMKMHDTWENPSVYIEPDGHFWFVLEYASAETTNTDTYKPLKAALIEGYIHCDIEAIEIDAQRELVNGGLYRDVTAVTVKGANQTLEYTCIRKGVGYIVQDETGHEVSWFDPSDETKKIEEMKERYTKKAKKTLEEYIEENRQYILKYADSEGCVQSNIIGSQLYDNDTKESVLYSRMSDLPIPTDDNGKFWFVIEQTTVERGCIEPTLLNVAVVEGRITQKVDVFDMEFAFYRGNKGNYGQLCDIADIVVYRPMVGGLAPTDDDIIGEKTYSFRNKGNYSGGKYAVPKEDTERYSYWTWLDPTDRDWGTELVRHTIDRRVAKAQEDKFNSLVGLSSVKHQVNLFKSRMEYEQARNKEMGITAAVKNDIGYHMAFTGNPGTGKTTVARYFGAILKQYGVISTDKIIEVDRSDLVGEYVGSTAQKTKKVCESAYDGILFIDEAYTLAQGGDNDFGKEAISTLIKEMEDNRDKLVVILAGYKDEMKELLNLNPGLKSRINITLEFPDYTEEELVQIAEKVAKDSNYDITPDGIKAFKMLISKKKVDTKFGNAREVRNILREAIDRKAENFAENKDATDFTKLTSKDFGVELSDEATKGVKEYLAEIDKLTGLKSVKKDIRDVVNKANYILKEINYGTMTADDMSLNMNLCFTGNPGTGKTTVARIYAKILHAIGLTKTDNFVEVSRSDLVAGYVGQTAEKTKKVCESAYGGVLFIDEAYSLASTSSPGDFGKEALATLIKEMEDNRDKLVVILAGYTKEMNEFMNVNSGLQSRIGKFIEFEDYTPDELWEIFDSLLHEHRVSITYEAITYVKDVIRNMVEEKTSNFGNAREIRKLYEGIWSNMVSRVEENDLMGEDRRLITKKDVDPYLE